MGSALLLSDTNTATVQTLVNALQSAGLTVNYIPGGISNYSGSPDASSYSSVILITGSFLSIDMPTSGQQSILNAQQNCITGVVMTEFAAFQVSNGKWTTLSPLILAPYVSGTAGTAMDFNLLYAGHPIWTGLANSFNTSVTIAYQRLGTPISGTVIVANCSICNSNSVFTYPQSGTAGRIVQIAHASHYSFASTFNWGNDANLLTMMINSVKWAVRLI